MEILRQITAWGTIGIVCTVIAGIYGMNFEIMPELGWTFGYPFALGLMAAASLLLTLIFRRKGWM